MAPRKARSSCGYRITDRLADSTKPNTLSNFQTRRLLLLSGCTLFSGPCSAAHHWHPPGMRPAAKQEATDTFATQAPISPVIPLNQTRALLMSLIQPLADWRSSDGCSRVTTVSHDPWGFPDSDSQHLCPSQQLRAFLPQF